MLKKADPLPVSGGCVGVQPGAGGGQRGGQGLSR